MGTPRLLKTHPTALWAAIGLGAMGIWMNLVGYSSAFSPPPPESEAILFEMSRYAFYSGIVFCGLFFIVVNNRITAIRVYLSFTVATIMCMGTATFGIAYQQQLFDPALLAIIGCFCSGIGYTWFVSSFYLMLARKETLRFAVASVAASLILETVVAAILNIALPQPAQVFIGTLIPLLACIFLIITQHSTAPRDLTESKVKGEEEHYMVLLVGIACISLLVIRAVTSVGLWGGIREDLSLAPLHEMLETLGSCAIFLGIAWVAFIQRSESALYERYQIPFLFIIAGCLISLLTGFATVYEELPVERIAVEAVELCGHLLVWSVVIACIKVLRFSAYRILGLAAVLFNALAIVWISIFEQVTSITPRVVLLVVLIAMFCVTLAPLRIRQTSSNSQEDAAGLLAREYKLTKREREIILLLIQGRSRPYIQQRLHLSDGTVKTHTTHIYAKLGIHSRQELLDMAERYTGDAQT
jgi:DNA-binding CsgD family transcriptional regulator